MDEACIENFGGIRAQSERLCETLAIEDYGLQAMAETSPPKWHLAHTTWFFETFVLKPFQPDFKPFHPLYEHLFNSYYNGIGDPYPRPRRGLLSRPTVSEVLAYRDAINTQVIALLAAAPGHGVHGIDEARYREIQARVTLGLHHEQQHQELLLTDIKYSLSCNPLYPPYLSGHLDVDADSVATPLSWTEVGEGLVTIGDQGPGFAYDNEGPAHRVFIPAFRLANRLVTNSEYQDFIDDGGYTRPELWLADGWACAQRSQWTQPLYWVKRDHVWFEYTLYGLMEMASHRPVCHLSAYEADAYARWAGSRLPTEFEWEAVAQGQPVEGQFLEAGELHPNGVSSSTGMQQLFGHAWNWTQSAYAPYPAYKPAVGAIGEYNGKFMCNQLVLRGGACLSSRSHLRATYRNFFYPADRWQCTGIRLATSLG